MTLAQAAALAYRAALKARLATTTDADERTKLKQRLKTAKR